MPVIYFDNFRGFDNTFIPLKKVNFFVGENSTGKTSVLKLIKIISDHRFWFDLNLTTEEAELGYYSEIASFANPKKKHFDIGILGDYRDKDKGISAIKLRFINKEGIPWVKELSLIVGNINIQAVVTKDGIKYRYSILNLENVTEENKLKHFKRWVNSNDLANKSFTKHDPKASFTEESLFFAVQLIINTSIHNKNKNIGFSYALPNFLQSVAWLAPIRTDPKRTYDSYKNKV